MSSTIPEGWSLLSFGDFLIDIRNGFSGTQNLYKEGVPVSRIETIAAGVIDFAKIGFVQTNEDIERYKLLKHDILFSHINSLSHIGKSAIYKEEQPLYLGMNLLRLRVDASRIFPVYFHQLLCFEEIRDYFRASAKSAINQASLNLQDIKAASFIFPSLSEQQKIASILTAVDEVIASTQAQINKLKDLKTGMMQELLTKGIGHTEFKDSPVGRIPKGWKFVLFDDVVTKVGSGITPSGGSAVYTATGVPFIRSQNVYEDGLRWDDVCFISETQHQKMKNSQLKPKDVLLNITGASIGRCYYLPEQFGEGNVNQHVCIIRCDHSLLLYKYLAHFINSNFGQKQIMNLQAGGNREGLNFQQIRAMGLPLPPLDEQLEISNVILSIESNISKRTAKLNSLCRLKKSLMHDLLTGKVRVVSP